MLTRHVANDPDFSEYFDSYFERLVGRSKRRLKEALPTPLRKPMTYDFCARALCRVVIQNMAAWVETGPKKNDDAFIDWLNRTIIAMSVSWQE